MRALAPMNRPTLLIDLDGTLTDPSQGIFSCIEHAFADCQVEPPPRSSLRDWIGPPLRSSFASVLGEARADRAVAAYRERFSRVGLFENEMIPGMRPFVQWAVDQGHVCHLATAKPTVFASRIIDHFELGDLITTVYGSELDGRYGDKRDLIGRILDQTGLDASDCLMIGDRKHDIIGAHANRVSAIGVLWGFGSRSELEQSGARRIATTPIDLNSLVYLGDRHER